MRHDNPIIHVNVDVDLLPEWEGEDQIVALFERIDNESRLQRVWHEREGPTDNEPTIVVAVIDDTGNMTNAGSFFVEHFEFEISDYAARHGYVRHIDGRRVMIDVDRIPISELSEFVQRLAFGYVLIYE